jgi:hypothetical protein
VVNWIDLAGISGEAALPVELQPVIETAATIMSAATFIEY